MNRKLFNVKLIEGYSSMRPKLTDKERIWFDKVIKLVEELGEADPHSSDKLMGLDCMLVASLTAAGLNHQELHFLIRETALMTCKIAMAVKLREAHDGKSNSH